MNFSLKFKILIGGLISTFSLILLANSFNAFTPIQLPIICSFSGPENSPDLLRLTEFSVTGPSNPKVGDTIYISFKLQNYGQYDLKLGSKGVFVAAKDPNNADVSFGFSRANTIFETGEIITVSASKILDKAGTWKFWPSYHLTFAGAPEKFGPQEWHACTFQVAQEILDSDRDGISDTEDSCPNEAETFNNYQDEDGCPDTLPAKTLPDLFIERIICDSQNQRIGYVIKNGGNGEALAGHKTALIIQGQKTEEDLVNINLPVGSIKENYFSNYKLTESVVISVCADYFESVEESSEDNNCRRSECVVKREEEAPPAPSLPDLTVDPYSPFSYDKNRGFYFTISNQGEADASSSEVAVYIAGVKVAEKRISPLRRGEKREETLDYEFSNCTICQEYRVEIRLDNRNEINEGSELNNSAFKNITCSHLLLPEFDLVIENISIDSGRINYNIANSGRGSSPETTARLFIDSRLIDTQNIPSLVGGESRRFSFSHYSCVGSEDRIEIRVMPAIKRLRDCQSGSEIGLGERDYDNNSGEITNQCQWPDLNLECSDYFPTCTVTNIGRREAPSNIAKIWCYKGGNRYFLSSYSIENLSPGQSINLSYEEAFQKAKEENCDRFFTERIKFDIKVDANDSIREIDEINNWESRYLSTLKGNMADISIERIWLESTNKVCYELKNKGEMSVKDFCLVDTLETVINLQGTCWPGSIHRDEPNLRGGESKTVCLDIPSEVLNRCREEILTVSISVDTQKSCARFFSPEENDFAQETFYNPCSSGMIDCSRCQPCDYLNVKGKILYQEADGGGHPLLDSNNNPIFKPARYLKFKIEGDVKTGTELTDSEGNFVVSISRNVGKEIHLKIGDCDMYGGGFNYAVRIARDLDRCNEYMIFDSRSVTIPERGDLNFGELKIWIDHDDDFDAKYRDAPWRYEPKNPCRQSACGRDKHDTQGGAAYFNIAETILVAREYADSKRFGSDSIGKVTAEYPDNACDGTPCYESYWGQIHLPEGWGRGFIDGTIVHEYGHHLENSIGGGTGGGGGSHTLCTEKNEEFAMTEGFAEYFGTIVPYHHQGNDPNFLSGPNVWYEEAEKFSCLFPTVPNKEVELTVVNFLWDLVDKPSGDFPHSIPEPFDTQNNKEDLIFKLFDRNEPKTLCDLINALVREEDVHISDIEDLLGNHGLRSCLSWYYGP